MNTSPPSAPSHSRPAVPLLVSSAQLTAAVVALASAVGYAIRDQDSDFAFGQWQLQRVPAPLVITASAVATIILLRRGRARAAITAALLPLAAHLLAVLSNLPPPKELSFGSWVRQTLTLPLGQWSMQPYPVLAKVTDWACMAALVLGAAVAAFLIAETRGQRRWAPAPPGAPIVIAATSITAIVASWAGERLSVEDDFLSQLPHHAGPPRPVTIALVAAAVTALVDAHTRWAAREGMTGVARVSAGVSGLMLLVPLGWLLWPRIRLWLWPPHVEGYGFGVGITDYPRWQGLAEGLTSLGSLLMQVAVAVATLTAAHRAAAVVGRPASPAPD